MKIDLTRVIKDFDDKPIENADGLAMTVGRIAVQSLSINIPDDKAEDKMLKFNLALDIHGEDSIDLTAEQISMLKKCVGKIQGPIVVGRFNNFVDPVGDAEKRVSKSKDKKSKD